MIRRDEQHWNDFRRFKEGLLAHVAHKTDARDICQWALENPWFARTLRRIAGAICRATCQRDPDNVLQKACLKILRKFLARPSLGINFSRSDAEIAGFVARILSRACLDARDPPWPETSLPAGFEPAAPTPSLSYEQLVEIIKESRDFTDLERTLLLNRLTGKKLTEIASELDEKYHTLYRVLETARDKLRRLLDLDGLDEAV